MTFHDDLIATRREGTAAPQVEQLAAAQEPPEPITYCPSSIPGAWTCSSCFGLVDGLLTEVHSAWHIDTGTV